MLQVTDVIKHFLPSFKSEVPNIADWFSYKSYGRTVSFDIPPLLGDKFLGLALLVLFTCKNHNHHFTVKAAVTNKTNGTTKYCLIPVHITRSEVYSLVHCINGDEISTRSGDRIRISFQRQLYSSNSDGEEEVPYEEVKVEMCAAHVIQKTPSTPDFPSILRKLIN